jgi:hypothetical protein
MSATSTRGTDGISERRFLATCAVAFLLAQVFAVVIHGFILDADYEPFRGTLLRSMDTDVERRAMLLPVVHLSFVIAFIWIFSRASLPGTWLRLGLIFGLVAWLMAHGSWLMAQVPLWLLWYAEQPWPGRLVIKQLGLELVATLTLGAVVAALFYRRPVAGRRH